MVGPIPAPWTGGAVHHDSFRCGSKEGHRCKDAARVSIGRSLMERIVDLEVWEGLSASDPS